MFTPSGCFIPAGTSYSLVYPYGVRCQMLSDEKHRSPASLYPRSALEVLLAGQRLGDPAVGRHAVHKPDVAADDGAVADRHAPEDRRPGIDGHVILDDGMPGDPL